MPNEFVRRELEHKRKELVERLDRIRRDRLHTTEPLSPDFAEQAGERENEEVLDALESSAQTELDEITLALDRVVRGNYGICTECGMEIEAPRLRAMPYATRCASCASLPRR